MTRKRNSKPLKNQTGIVLSKETDIQSFDVEIDDESLCSVIANNALPNNPFVFALKTADFEEVLSSRQLHLIADEIDRLNNL